MRLTIVLLILALTLLLVGSVMANPPVRETLLWAEPIGDCLLDTGDYPAVRCYNYTDGAISLRWEKLSTENCDELRIEGYRNSALACYNVWDKGKPVK